jgi:NADH/NAD ratio-sensing transcriptional regulator Rex
MVDAAVDARFRELDRHSFIPPGSNTQRLEEYYRFAEQLCLQARAYASSDAIST